MAAQTFRRKQILNQPLGAGQTGPFSPGGSYAQPIIRTYDPTTADQADLLGQIWVNMTPGSEDFWVATSVVSGLTTWTSPSTSPVGGTFTSITNSGNTTLSALSQGVVMVGAITPGLLSSQSLTDGQLLIGKTGFVPQPGEIKSAGGTITVSYTGGNINLEATGEEVAWTTRTIAGTYAPNVDTGEINNVNDVPANVIFTMPSTVSVGNVLEIIQLQATDGNGYKIDLTANSQTILFNGTTAAYSTSLIWTNNATGNQFYSSIKLLAVDTDTWLVQDVVGTSWSGS